MKFTFKIMLKTPQLLQIEPVGDARGTSSLLGFFSQNYYEVLILHLYQIAAPLKL